MKMLNVVVVRLTSWFVSVLVSRLEIAEFPGWSPLVCSIGLMESMSSDEPGKRRDA